MARPFPVGRSFIIRLQSPASTTSTTTVPDFDPFFGTSAAAPSVAGVVADMLQANPNLTFARAKQILQQTALPFGDPLVAGAGLVDAAAAVQLAMQTATFATTANLVLRTNALDPSGLNPNLNQSLYRIYNIGSNALLAANQLGNVGSDWGFVTLGGFIDGDTSRHVAAQLHQRRIPGL